VTSGTEDGQADVVQVLERFLDEELRREVIGGVSIAEVLDFVDLDVAYSPVVELPVDDDWPRPERLRVTALVKRDDGRYEARRQTEAGPTFDLLDPGQVRIMRARYLLCRDHFARTIESYGYSDQQRILADFFPHGLWRPK
jgi:hypothetical protein